VKTKGGGLYFIFTRTVAGRILERRAPRAAAGSFLSVIHSPTPLMALTSARSAAISARSASTAQEPARPDV
jgi:hypothetical protein